MGGATPHGGVEPSVGFIEALPYWIPPTPREIRLSYSYQYLSIRNVAENRSSLMYTDLL